jgi:hypothetical protein
MRLLLAVMLSMTTVLLIPVPASAKAAPVTKRLAVVVIQNGDTDDERTRLADTTYLRNIFFGSSGSLTTWMPAVTHGLLSFTPAGDGVYLAQPSAALAAADKAGCHSNLARTNAQDHLTSLGVAWDSLAVVFDIYGCTWGGLGQMPGRVTWYPPRPSLSVIVHEFGHNQGYPHQSKRDCTGGNLGSCNANDYSGNTPMGSGGSGRGYSSVELLHSGWLEPGWLRQVSAPGTFSLKPLYAPVSTTGVRVVEYRVSSSLSYVIETRAQGTAVDTSVNNPGVRVYAVTNRDYKDAYMINPGARYVPASTVLTDSANKLTITVRSSSASGATVAVAAITGPSSIRPSASRSPSPSPSVSPTESAIPPSADADPSPIDSEGVITDIAADQPTRKGNPIYVVIGIGLVLALALAAGATVLIRDRHRPRHRMR